MTSYLVVAAILQIAAISTNIWTTAAVTDSISRDANGYNIGANRILFMAAVVLLLVISVNRLTQWKYLTAYSSTLVTHGRSLETDQNDKTEYLKMYRQISSTRCETKFLSTPRKCKEPLLTQHFYSFPLLSLTQPFMTPSTDASTHDLFWQSL